MPLFDDRFTDQASKGRSVRGRRPQPRDPLRIVIDPCGAQCLPTSCLEDSHSSWCIRLHDEGIVTVGDVKVHEYRCVKGAHLHRFVQIGDTWHRLLD